MTENAFPFDAVLFDMDGTLADSEPTQERSFVQTATSLGIDLPDDFHDKILGTSDEKSHRWLVDECGLTLSLQEWMEARFECYFELLVDLQPFDDAIKVWDTLKEIGVSRAVVSNSDRMLVSANLKGIGLTDPGLISVSRNDVKAGKPAPDSYLRGAYLLGAEPTRCAAVEDSATGRDAARAAGMTVFMMPSFEDIEPGHALADLAAMVESAKAIAA